MNRFEPKTKRYQRQNQRGQEIQQTTKHKTTRHKTVGEETTKQKSTRQKMTKMMNKSPETRHKANEKMY